MKANRKWKKGRKGGASDLQLPLHLSLLSSLFFPPSWCDLSRPSNYSNEQLRAEEEEEEEEEGWQQARREGWRKSHSSPLLIGPAHPLTW